ncbi:MAG TPA: hypothetical protein VFQ54_01750, partial [Thermomicrobiales bacterium]|nr:hypothetical protein [Thermomicrobiales bacterium]
MKGPIVALPVTEHPDTEQGSSHDRPFEERYVAAMEDAQLSRNLTNFQQGWKASREPLVEEIDFQQLRHEMKAAKTDAIDNLDHYLD